MTTRADETVEDLATAATTNALRLEPRSNGRGGGSGMAPLGWRIERIGSGGNRPASSASAGTAATRTGSGGDGAASGRLATCTGGGSGGAAGWAETPVAAAVRRGRRLRKRATRSSGSQSRPPPPWSARSESRSYWPAIRQCEGSLAVANRPTPRSALVRHSRLDLAVPIAFMSRTSATREDTSITRPA